MLLVAATEAIDENVQINKKESEKPVKKVKKPLLIIESDDDE